MANNAGMLKTFGTITIDGQEADVTGMGGISGFAASKANRLWSLIFQSGLGMRPVLLPQSSPAPPRRNAGAHFFTQPGYTP